MMLYIGSMLSYKHDGHMLRTNHEATIINASSKEEAIGVLQIQRSSKYPPENGWVNDIVVTNEVPKGVIEAWLKSYELSIS